MTKAILLERTFQDGKETSVWCVHFTFPFGIPRECFHVTCERTEEGISTSISACRKKDGHHWVVLPDDVEAATLPIMKERLPNHSMSSVMV
jgi:hypothetical protein